MCVGKFKNEHFHNNKKNCNIERSRAGWGTFSYFCKTHKIDICKCGWEFGWHGGDSSILPKYKMTKRLGTIPIRIINPFSKHNY